MKKILKVCLSDKDKYLKEIVILSGEVLSGFRVKVSSWKDVATSMLFLDKHWTELESSSSEERVNLVAGIISDDDFKLEMQWDNKFFSFYEKYIVLAGKQLLKDSKSMLLKKQRSEESWLENAEEYINQILYLFCVIINGTQNGLCSHTIILNTLSFLFENWKDMGEEEWNDPYILLEELVNSTDFPKTDEDQKSKTEFCEKYQNEIRGFGVALQEDLKKRGFFEPQES
jgi:hypothetical protein